MIAFRCLACRRDWILGRNWRSLECSCRRSRATFDGEVVELHGPCTAGPVAADRDNAPEIRRKAVPALL
jgi:hypothetical protein